MGGLDEKVSEPLLWELFLQAGPVVNTHMPKDRVTGQHQGEYVVRDVLCYIRGQTAPRAPQQYSQLFWNEQPKISFSLSLAHVCIWKHSQLK